MASFTDEDLKDLGQYLKEKDMVKDETVGSKVHKKVFKGSYATKILVEDGFAENTQQSLMLGEAMMKKGIFKAVLGEQKFRNDDSLYRFAEDFVGLPPEKPSLPAPISTAGDGTRAFRVTFEFPSGPLNLQLANPPRGKPIEGGILLQGVNNKMLDGKVEKGDYIVEIAGVPVHGLQMKDVTKKIVSLPRPLSITFQRSLEPPTPPPASPIGSDKSETASLSSTSSLATTYSVVFREGLSMGLRLEHEKFQGYHITVVRAVTGQAEESGKIKVGDVVLRVNGVDVLGSPHKAVVDILRSCAPPKTVEFVTSEGLEGELTKIKQEEEKDDSTDFSLSGDVRALNIKKGILYKMGAVVKSWKNRYFHLRVECIEYFKDAAYMVPRGRLNLIGAQCVVRSIPGDPMIMVSKKPKLWAKHLIELRVNDRKLILAAASKEDKDAWIEALQLAIDAANALSQAQAHDVGEAYDKAVQLANERAQEAGAIMPDENQSFCSDDDKQSTADQSENGGADVASVISYDGKKFPRPRVHCTVISASNLKETNALAGGSALFSSVNPYCEVSLGHETFRTPVAKGQRNPVWTEDNDCTLESPLYDGGLLSIRVKSRNTIRGDELLSTLTIDLNDLPNMQKVIKKFPLVLAYSTMQQSTITLALEYQNPKKEYEQSQKLKTMSNDTYEEVLDEERKKALEIKQSAEDALQEAQRKAEQLKEEAERLMEDARLKAGEELEKARQEIEAAKEAAAAQQSEVEQLTEATRDVQNKTRALLEQDISSALVPYKKMIAAHESLDLVQKRMIADGVPEMTVKAFIEGHRAMEETFSFYQKQWAKEKEEQRKKEQAAKKASEIEMFAGLSADQTALLRRLAKLEKQLANAGIQIAEDIPYEEAKAKVEEISKRMAEIGSADVTHPDPATQKALREEYFRLEQDMEKYNNALMLTEEYQEEQRRQEREWDEKHAVPNMEALRAIRRMMPVEVNVMTEQALKEKGVPPAIAMRFKRTNVLQLLRTDPQNIMRWHPSTLESLRMTGLTLVERRALHCHLKDIAEKWQEQEKEELAGRKWGWFKGLKQTFKSQLLADERGQAPKSRISYDLDLGFPPEDVYYKVEVTKADVEDAGMKAMQEAQAHARQKRANARQAELKKHYKRDIRAVAAAEGALADIENLMDKLEVAETKWYTDRSKGTSEAREELASFSSVLNDMKAVTMMMAERAGMKLSGKRNAALDGPDTRSPLEISFSKELLDWITEYTDVIQTLMQENGAKDSKVTSAVSSVEQLVHELRTKNERTLAEQKAKLPPPQRPLKPRSVRRQEIEQKAGGEEGSSARGGGGPPAGRGGPMGGRGGGRADLFSAIKGGRGGRGDAAEAPQNDLLASIRGRGPGRGGGGRGPAPPMNDLLGAIRGRSGGRGRGGGGGRGDLMSAIAARKKE